jgi:hypothetical protein
MKSQFVEQLLENVYSKMDEAVFDEINDTMKKLIKQILSLSSEKLEDLTGLSDNSEVSDFVDRWIGHITEKQPNSKNVKDSFKEYTGKDKLSEKESKKLIK